jgi:Zn-dependent alcohol dehydrogenase
MEDVVVAAAVLTALGEPLEVWDDIEVSEPRSDEVLVQMAASGVCHTDLSMSTGALPKTVDVATAALLGCGVLVVLGCGGVGLNVIQGARLRGAATIIGVDTDEAKLKLAETFGATHNVKAGEADVVAEVRALTDGRGADVAFEVVGASATIDQAVRATRRGGQAVLVGVPGVDVRLAVRALTGIVAAGRTITGCWYGSCDPQRDVAIIVDLYHRGELYLDELIFRRISLTDVNDPLASLNSVQLARTLIEY